jgi:hypothetical protein
MLSLALAQVLRSGLTNRDQAFFVCGFVCEKLSKID